MIVFISFFIILVISAIFLYQKFVNVEVENNISEDGVPKKFWNSTIQIERWTWESVSYSVQTVDENGKILSRIPYEQWEKQNPNKEPDHRITRVWLGEMI